VRVYLPATMSLLARAVATGSVDVPVASAVTPTLREWYVEGDAEELEYAAMLAAARSSLRLLAADPETARRRVVVAAEIPDGTAQPAPDLDRSAVRLPGPVPISAVVSAHVDDSEAAEDVSRAAALVAAADSGDEDARFAVDGVEDHELGWYAAQEIGPLVELDG
jgi:uncharacterized protein DUF6912